MRISDWSSDVCSSDLPFLLARQAAAQSQDMVPFLATEGGGAEWDGSLVQGEQAFVTGIGAGTTYPDYKPAPFIVSSQVEGVDLVTVVTEGIFSYCGVRVKIATGRHLGPEQAAGHCAAARGRPGHTAAARQQKAAP